jgi:HSP20 family protein
MQILRWDPFGMMRDLDRLFEGEFALGEGRSWVPRIDVLHEKDMLKIRAEVPGVPIDAIDVTVEDGALTMSGTRSFTMVDEDEGYYRKELAEGTFKRTIFLPDRADIDAIEAVSTDGIIEISIPMKTEVLPKTVKVAIK